MKAYIAIKYYEDCSNRKLIEEISSALEINGFETTCIVRDMEKWGQVKFYPDKLMQGAIKAIESSGVIVIDLTEKGTGIGIEAGYAYAKKIPIVTIAEKGSNISTTLRGISNEVFMYNNVEDLVAFFRSIKQTIGV